MGYWKEIKTFSCNAYFAVALIANNIFCLHVILKSTEEIDMQSNFMLSFKLDLLFCVLIN